MAKAKKEEKVGAGKAAPPSELTTAKELDSLLKEVTDSNLVQDTLKRIKEQYGIADVTKPGEMPKFPSDVTKLSSDEVGQLYGAYESEVAYIRFKLSEVESILDYANNILSTAKNTLYLGYRQEVARDEAQAWVGATRNIVQVEKFIMEKNVERRLLDARYDIYSKYAASMSREITRRKQDDEVAGRSGGSRGSGSSHSSIRGKELNPVKKFRKGA